VWIILFRYHSGRFTGVKVTGQPKKPNRVIRRIREQERHESRGEFAAAMAQMAIDLKESVTPSERYVARLEDGDIRQPGPAYRRVLAALCNRTAAELGFASVWQADIGSGSAGDSSSITLYGPGHAESLRSGPVWNLGAGSPADSSEWPLWFGVRLAQIISLVDNWQGSTAQFDPLQDLLHQEILLFDATAPDSQHPAGVFHALSRRQTLVTLAALPLALGKSGAALVGTLSSDAATESFLSRCAASLTACWHLLRGSDLPTVNQMISGYMVALEGIARQHSRYQPAAARLVSQAHRISGIIALHRDKLKIREYHCRQALHYATIASDASSQASALISLASTHFYNSDPIQAVAVYEQTFGLEAGMPPLQRSRAQAELSVVYGQLGREQDAMRSAGLAEELYPDNPENDRSFLYAEFTPASLTLESGLAYVALAERYPNRNHQVKAAETFSQTEQATSAAPDRIRLEIINHQARAAVLRNDLDEFEIYLSRAIDGIAMLASRQRQKEIEAAWRQAAETWPHERRLLALSEGVRSAKHRAIEGNSI
jgi:tetratricopeptide (TPR) repeat protein